ncbi:hypothetical protein BZB76_4737 [Actinomadura pelletieri DSM 43383]|uniref:Uncharacterized protein n=1 Tax=Actinomadura pelletieri DSM 43383 TaxID=1120940 RepID=A0A495QIQ8_9ACTN|nr:hypothetical protein [Actinomadura pelletieri]RKS71926.1 hypothetical protein BZB76_4737 [Actinomadura pelletieri DSM 43383]
MAMPPKRPPAQPGPGRTEPTASTIVRRLEWKKAPPFVALLLAGAAGLGAWALLGLGTTGAIAAGGGAVLLVAGAMFIVLSVVRARTELGPDGIRNRSIRKEVFVPWDDIEDIVGLDSPPRTITLVLRGGGQLTLAAVVDNGTTSEGLDFDDTVALIRERASLDEDGAGEAPRPPARPLSLRPSRRPLLWVVPAMIVIVAVAARAFGTVQLSPMIGLSAMATVYWITLALKLLRGRTEADAEGIRNRLIRRTTEITWHDVTGVSVTPSLFGRIVIVQRQKGKPQQLAAPRVGLLARDPGFDATVDALAALAPPRMSVNKPPAPAVRMVQVGMLLIFGAAATLAWSPWLDAWWPGREEAQTLPRACAVADPVLARQLLPGHQGARGNHYDGRLAPSSDCSYSDGDDGDLEIEVELERRSGFTGAIEEARASYADSRRSAETVARQRITTGKNWTLITGDVPGLGDQAWRSVTVHRSDGVTDIRLLVRHRNVLLDIQYTVRRPKEQAGADAERLARTALSRIEFR